MRFQFVHIQRPRFPLRTLCRVMGVTESGYHSWRIRPQTRAEYDAQLLARIEMVHDESKGIYGAPRVHSVLKGAQVPCSRHRVARLMRSVGRRGKGKNQYKVTTDSDHAHPVAENLLMRRFEVAEPNTVWASDMTFIATSEGWLYLAVVLDLHSRMVVGWSMGSRMTTELPLAALKMAFDRRHPAPGLLHHSDRGSQYASKTYQHALKGMRMTCSMSTCLDCQGWRCESTADSSQERSQNGPERALEVQTEAGSLRLTLSSTASPGFGHCPNAPSHGCPLRTMAFRITSSLRIHATRASFLAFPRSTSWV